MEEAALDGAILDPELSRALEQREGAHDVRLDERCGACDAAIDV